MTNRDSEPSTPQDDEANIHGVDTVPPPESGDAYSAMTVVREAPPAVLEAIRKRKLEEAVKKADAAHEKKVAEKSVEITVEIASDKPSDMPIASLATPLVAADDQDEPAPESPPASALASQRLPHIEGYIVPGPSGVEPEQDEDVSSLSIRPRLPEEAEAEHADASILAIEAAPEGPALRSPFAPPPRRNAETVTLVVIALIALAAGWLLSALFR